MRIDKQKIKEVNEFIPSYSKGDRTRSFLKIQDGCDYFCTFCTIPLARGKSRNHSVAETVNAAKEVAQTAAKEVILTGVNIGDFGQGEGENFFELIQELDKIEGIERFRISSIEPNLLSNDIIDFITDKSNPWALIVVSSNDRWKTNCGELITLEKGEVKKL